MLPSKPAPVRQLRCTSVWLSLVLEHVQILLCSGASCWGHEALPTCHPVCSATRCMHGIHSTVGISFCLCACLHVHFSSIGTSFVCSSLKKQLRLQPHPQDPGRVSTTAAGASLPGLGQMQHDHSFRGGDWSHLTMSPESSPSSESQDLSPQKEFPTKPYAGPESSKAQWLPSRHYLSQNKAWQSLPVRDDFMHSLSHLWEG